MNLILKRKETWRLGHLRHLFLQIMVIYGTVKLLELKEFSSILLPWVSKGNAIQLLENIKESPTGFFFQDSAIE